jgi:glucose-1-phosphate thymidylyltransferase
LAAGYATRLYPLTLDTPKALLDIGGAPILDHICGRIRRIPGAQRIVVISNARFYNHFEAWRHTHPDWDIDLLNDGTASDVDKLGALGDIAFALDTLGIDDDLFIMAGDNLIAFEEVHCNGR